MSGPECRSDQPCSRLRSERAALHRLEENWDRRVEGAAEVFAELKAAFAASGLVAGTPEYRRLQLAIANASTTAAVLEVEVANLKGGAR